MKQGWEIKTIADVCTFIKNGANIKQERGAGGVPITRIETLSGGVFNRDRLGYANLATPDKYLSYVLEYGDLLFSHINSKTYIGRTVVYVPENDEQVIHGMNLLRLKLDFDLMSPFFFQYYTRTDIFKAQVANRRKDAVNQSSITTTDIKTILLPVPPIAEQEKIVAELDCLSGIIEKKKQQLKELDNLAQSIFYEMFGDPVENDKGWSEMKLGDICVSKKEIKRASKQFASADIIHYIDIASIDNVENVITGTAEYIFSEAPSRAQQVVCSGDVLISLVRPNLKNIAMVHFDNDLLVASSGFCVVRANNLSDKRFIRQILLSDSFTSYLMDRVSGANYPAVREDDIRDCKLGVPPLSLQQEFASKIEAIEKQKELIAKSIRETETLFNSRMDYYFN